MPSRKSVVGILLVVLAAALAGGQPTGSSLLKATFGKLPVYFVENRGVYPDQVAYSVQGADKTLFFTKDGITFRLKGRDRAWVVKLAFVGANPDAVPRGEDRQQAVFSHFRGPEKNWKTGLRTYARIVYQDLWPGIDLVYQGTVNRLKYEFRVDPGADPGRIKLSYHGATEVEVTPAGGLRVETPVGGFEDEPPVAYQSIDGVRVPVETAFGSAGSSGEGGRAFGFRVGGYDAGLPLILDPAVLVYCGFIGGSQRDDSSTVVLDANSNAYVCGTTKSDQNSFPVRVGPDSTYNGGGNTMGDAFVAKVNPQGTQLIYCGYIGGADDDAACGIAVDSAGNAYVTGGTYSDESTFPVTVGPFLVHHGGADAFVAKVDSTGTRLQYCGFIGGSRGSIPGYDFGNDIAIDSLGYAYVTGITDSTQQFPVKVGPDLTYNGNGDAFVAKVDRSGASLVYCGYIGGESRDEGTGIDVTKGGTAYVTGWTLSNESTFPVKIGPDVTFNGFPDAFVTKVTWSGVSLEYCGYIGGSQADFGGRIAVNETGVAFVIGQTSSTETTSPIPFPVRVGPDLTYNGGANDAFLAKVQAQGQGLGFCGFIGGSSSDSGIGIALDPQDNVYFSGCTASSEITFPAFGGPDATFNGVQDGFVGKALPTGASLIYCGYIGGSMWDGAGDLTVDPNGNVYVVGTTYSDGVSFPVRRGPFLTRNNLILSDGFIAKIAECTLGGSGSTQPGSTVRLNLTATDDAGLGYQLGSSLGTGPIPIDTRHLDLSPDPLLLVSVNDYWPWIFQGYRGVFDAKGHAQAAIHLPNLTALIGLRLHSAFVTLHPSAPSGLRSISNAFSFTITK